MTGRKSAFVVEPKAPLEFRLAAFADTNQRIVFYDTEGLAPYFEPVSGAPFLRIEYRNAARVLDRQKRQRKNNQNTRDRKPEDSTPAACESHHKDRNAKSRQRRARRGEH